MPLDPVRRRLAASAALLLCPALRAARAEPPAAGASLRVGGTGSALGSMRLLGQVLAARAPINLVVVPNLGSGGGLRALRAGAIDAAVIGRALSAEEAAAGLVAHEYGRSPFVLVANQQAATGVTRAELAALLDGSRSQWPDGTPVRLVLRPASDGDSAMLAAFSPAIEAALRQAQARPGMVIATTDQDAVDEAERIPGALTTSTLSLLKSEGRNRLQVLALDGVAPTVATLASGRYPYFKRQVLVTRADAAPAVRRLVALLAAPEGRALLEANGHLLPS